MEENLKHKQLPHYQALLGLRASPVVTCYYDLTNVQCCLLFAVVFDGTTEEKGTGTGKSPVNRRK